jgi:hypothetical protein
MGACDVQEWVDGMDGWRDKALDYIFPNFQICFLVHEMVPPQSQEDWCIGYMANNNCGNTADTVMMMIAAGHVRWLTKPYLSSLNQCSAICSKEHGHTLLGPHTAQLRA